MEEFLQQYGYIILAASLVAKSLPVAGGLASNNTVLYLSGLFAGLGEFNISLVLLVGFIAVVTGDTAMFLIGKYSSDNFPKLQKAQDKSQGWLDKVHKGHNKFTKFYMFSGFLRSYLPFFLGYSKMTNATWVKKVVTCSIVFIPSIALLGYAVGRLDVSGGVKAIVSAGLYILSIILFTKISHQIYEESDIDIKQITSKLRVKQ